MHITTYTIYPSLAFAVVDSARLKVVFRVSCDMGSKRQPVTELTLRLPEFRALTFRARGEDREIHKYII